MKCKVCGEEIKDNEYIKISSRCYIHKNCESKYKLLNKNNSDLEELKNYIYTVLFDKDTPSYVWMQIQQMYKNKDYKFTYKGMLLTLKYYYEILGNYFNKSKGVGIIPYKYDEAREYWIKMNSIMKNIKSFKDKSEEKKITTSITNDRSAYKNIDMETLFK
jgi:hypothetical protein